MEFIWEELNWNVSVPLCARICFFVLLLIIIYMYIGTWKLRISNNVKRTLCDFLIKERHCKIRKQNVPLFGCNDFIFHHLNYRCLILRRDTTFSLMAHCLAEDPQRFFPQFLQKKRNTYSPGMARFRRIQVRARLPITFSFFKSRACTSYRGRANDFTPLKSFSRSILIRKCFQFFIYFIRFLRFIITTKLVLLRNFPRWKVKPVQLRYLASFSFPSSTKCTSIVYFCITFNRFILFMQNHAVYQSLILKGISIHRGMPLYVCQKAYIKFRHYLCNGERVLILLKTTNIFEIINFFLGEIFDKINISFVRFLGRLFKKFYYVCYEQILIWM